MKKILGFVLVVTFALGLYTSVHAVTKCESDGKGGMCCWDTEREGPWKPLSCQ